MRFDCLASTVWQKESVFCASTMLDGDLGRNVGGYHVNGIVRLLRDTDIEHVEDIVEYVVYDFVVIVVSVGGY